MPKTRKVTDEGRVVLFGHMRGILSHVFARHHEEAAHLTAEDVREIVRQELIARSPETTPDLHALVMGSQPAHATAFDALADASIIPE